MASSIRWVSVVLMADSKVANRTQHSLNLLSFYLYCPVLRVLRPIAGALKCARLPLLDPAAAMSAISNFPRS